ncbi:MAG: hypothetical protein ACR2KG_08295 [Nocardioidaceae bacterium]
MTESAESVRPMPLGRGDPPALGNITLTGRLETTDSGIVYAGRIAARSVTVVVLSEGAETDSYARARFHDAVARALDHDDTIVASEDEPDIAPWVALRADDWATSLRFARGLLAPVTLEHLLPVGRPRGPAFRPHWFRRRSTGRWRLWPLPWPASLTIGARWTYLTAFAVIVAIAAIALWIAVKVFENQPPAPVRPPFPQLNPTVSPSPTSTPTPTPTSTSATIPQV